MKIVPWRLAVEDYANTGYVAYSCMFIMKTISAYTRVGDFDTPTHQPTCTYVCMYVSVTIKNARMSHLGMQFYTTTKGVSGETAISREC